MDAPSKTVDISGPHSAIITITSKEECKNVVVGKSSSPERILKAAKLVKGFGDKTQVMISGSAVGIEVALCLLGSTLKDIGGDSD